MNTNVRNVENVLETAQVTDIDAQLLALRKEVESDMKKITAPITLPESRLLEEHGILAKELSSKKHIRDFSDDVMVDLDAEDL